MATSQAIEQSVMGDIKKLLVDALIGNVIVATEQQPEAATFVRVAVLNLRGNLAGGNIPTGMRQIDMAVEVHSYMHDDTDGSALETLTASVRTAIYDSGIIATLNTKTTYNTYYGLSAGDDIPDVEDRYRLRSIQFSLILKPETTGE